MEEKILKLMKTLDLTREEAIELIDEDKEVDRMKDKDVDNDLSAEHKKIKKQCTNVKKGVNAYGKTTTRELKPDENKRAIIKVLEQALIDSGIATNVEITNIQKMIAFSIGSENFEIDLKRKRVKK